MQRLEGWTQKLVDFANLKIIPGKWKSQWFELMRPRRPMNSRFLERLWKTSTEEDWKKDGEWRDYRSVQKLQKQLIEYLLLVADSNYRSRAWRLDDILDDVEEYSGRKGLSYQLLIVRKTDEDSELFDGLNQSKMLPWGSDHIRIAKFPLYNSREEWFYTCLAGALESGELVNVRRCRYRRCGKFMVAKRPARKKYCSLECGWNFNNERADRKEDIRKQRREKAEKAKRKVKKKTG